MEKLPRTKIIEEAARISNERGKSHGPLHRSFGAIAAMWSAYLTSIHTARTGEYVEINLNRRDVAQMLVNLKQMRIEFGDATLADNYVDIAGYAGLAGELSGANLGKDHEQPV